MISHADEIAEDSESHLAKLWGLAAGTVDFPWIEGFTAIAQAKTVEDLQKGIDDLHAKVTRSVNLPLLKAWRTYHWDGFRDGVVDSLDQTVIGYKAARTAGKCIHLNSEEGDKFAKALRSEEAARVFLRCTFDRALLVADQTRRKPSKEEYDHAKPLLTPYVKAYTEYLIGCATKFAPESNDLGDSECFLYLQNGNAFLSSDRRWLQIARQACPSHCSDPEGKV